MKNDLTRANELYPEHWISNWFYTISVHRTKRKKTSFARVPKSDSHFINGSDSLLKFWNSNQNGKVVMNVNVVHHKWKWNRS